LGQRGDGAERLTDPLKPSTLTRVIVDVPKAPAGIERLSGLADMVKSGAVDMTWDGADTAVVTIIPAKSVSSRQRGNDANLMDNTNTRLADTFP